ncbi:MAG: penicillin-binding transpeptidase domain-containing protein, partial [Gaiellales bacterium]
LAMGSYLTYNPNVFTSPAAKDQRVVRQLINPNNKLAPMLNRAIAGQYPPASTYKVITGIAAMEEGFVTPDKALPCPAFLEISKTVFNNHVDRDLGPMSLSTALETSCDTYFYNLAVQFFNDPGSPLQAWSTKFGLGQETGIDIPGEMKGIIPTPAWKEETWGEGFAGKWSSGDSVNMSIGQGNVLTTPVQMTRVFGAIANDGKLVTPRLAKSVQSLDGREEKAFPPSEEVDLQIAPSHLAATIDGLVKVNNGANGTASAVFSGFKVTTAGKSGTAEVGSKEHPRSDHAWYCGYAPVEDPEIVACAFIDGGAHGGATAGPVVLQMFQQWFGTKGGNTSVGRTID